MRALQEKEGALQDLSITQRDLCSDPLGHVVAHHRLLCKQLNTPFSEQNRPLPVSLCTVLVLTRASKMAAEAAFKDVPEIFEVSIRAELLIQSTIPIIIVSGRVGGVSHGTNRGPWCASNQISSTPPLPYPKPSGSCFHLSIHIAETRTLSASFRELGPPDLCHVVKSTGRAGTREVSSRQSSPNFPSPSPILTNKQLDESPILIPPLTLKASSYHYVSGVDASSSASLAAYINSLTYSIEEPQAWFTKGPTWKVKNGCFWYVLSLHTDGTKKKSN
jgi:ChAPs (Chs5p-Arf1p-binding proteins)